jgi:signal transduction histidine kinase
LGYVSLAAIVLLVLEVPLGLSFARRERDNLSSNVLRDATALAALAEEGLDHPDAVDLHRLALRYGTQTGANVTLVDSGGNPFVTLHNRDVEADEKALRPLMTKALVGGTQSATRFIDEGTSLLGVVTPIATSKPARGAVVITYPTAVVDRRIERNWFELALLAAVVLAVASAVGLRLARSVTRPLQHLEDTASALGSGDLQARADIQHGPAEVRALAAEFNEMAARLQELVDAQRVFVADASHQLRTPLTALRLRLESLESMLPPAARGDLEAATVESRRLSRLVDGLLALARAEGARAERQAIDVNAVVEERGAAWGALAEERGVQLIASVGRARPLALVVPGHLEQIVDNFLANALEVAPEGSTVTMSVVGAGGWVAVHVIDEGPGMSPEERRNAFDRFWRGRDADGVGGSGLGLAIVRQLATANSGSAELRSGAVGGIDAAVTLPAV